jgi:putative Ca2+/H+ antiporter (TMEM165/GDT1 family)
MELGDKTQFAVIALAAEYNAIVQVLTGVMLAFILLTALAAVSGSYTSKCVSSRYTKIGAAAIFLLFGIIFLIQAATGTRIL